MLGLRQSTAMGIGAVDLTVGHLTSALWPLRGIARTQARNPHCSARRECAQLSKTT
jgi:hypothetical protein